ncbi:MAG: hypothetical protein HRU31_15415 [Rhodobacteraceae bacterium]|nr:hypothetical protein [Paracoccaceae bacterium]
MWTRSQTVFAFVALIGITACDVPDNPTRQQGGEIQVQLTKGLNCYSDECFRYDPAGSIDVAGRLPARAAPNLSYVSAAQFRTMYQTALRRPSVSRSLGDG